ncbi:aromatic amino acid transporter [Formosa sp. PL04]|uniref:aromatic amino acid transporter n=1 Tax=Formosa sp. PL04 TaxID=3081755 RepID=UPI002980B576|nr:aromatic amino acid transporter [Formosa sp. PL04]MDW5290246.1 aromatic amino acid transporter [Formosa sp. PL04]
MNLTKNQSALSGIMITAGTTIGAGIFSLPIVSSGMWFVLSLVCLLFLWFLNYLSALYILEANLLFTPGASFDTISTKILGKNWSILIGLSIAFLMYILLYAYFSAFGNIAIESLGWDIFKTTPWLQGVMSIALGSLLAFIVWLSTAMVGRISTVLVFGMIISFTISIAGFALQIETTKLFDTTENTSSYLPYLWAALPYFMTSFGLATVVPSLYKFYGKNPVIIKKSLLWGSSITFFVYVLFLSVAFGNISRQEFIAINEAGGNIGHLIHAFQKDESSPIISFILNLFSNFAIITSFLGVGLALFDYIADKFSFPDNVRGRFKSACITFIPPGIISFFFPNGFIAAIGFAGLVVIFGFFISPFFIVKKLRHSKVKPVYKVWGGHGLLLFFIISSVLVGACQVLAMLDYLPKW